MLAKKTITCTYYVVKLWWITLMTKDTDEQRNVPFCEKCIASHY